MPPTAAPCDSVLTCYLIFNVIPTGKQILVTDVSCGLTLVGNNADNIWRITLGTRTTTGGESDRSTFLSPVVMNALSATNITYTINGTTRHLYKAGERPVVRFATIELGSVNPICTIMGKVGNPPE